MAHWTAKDIPDLTGRAALVTGATSGIGLETARELAKAGAHVLLGARDQTRAAAAAAKIRETAPAANLEIIDLDLASLTSVRAAADEVRSRVDRLDLLINNAGLMAPPFRRTHDGFEQQIGVNHLGHFALTGLLLSLLTGSDDARVVTVSSVGHRMGSLDVDDLSWQRRRYSRWRAYGQSKLANLLFTIELSRRAGLAGLELRAVAAHPGLATTNLVASLPSTRSAIGLRIAHKITDVFGQDAAHGALPTLYGATAADVISGEYFGPDGRKEQSGFPTRVGRSKAALDGDLATALWDRSEELTGVTYDFV